MDEQTRIAIRGLLLDIDHQIAVLKAYADEVHIPVAQVRTSDGSWPMIDLLLAKANAHNALATLSKK